MIEDSLPEHRCSCGRLLFRGVLTLSRLQIKCHSCGKISVLGEDFSSFTARQYALILHVTIKDNRPLMRVVDASPSITKALGYTREEVVAMPPNQIDMIARGGGYDESFMRYTKTDMPPVSMESVHEHKDGHLIKVRARLMHRREPWGFVIYGVYDVLATHDVHLDDELRIIASSHPGTCLNQLELSAAGVCTYVSSGFAHALDMNVREISHRDFFNFVTSSDQARFRKLYLDHAKGRGSFREEGLVCEGRNGPRRFDAHFLARYRDDGIFDGYTVALWPLT